LTEAITDPDLGGGWWDSSADGFGGDEIGDLALDTSAANQAVGYSLDGYVVQKEWSNLLQGNSLNDTANFVITGGVLTVNGDQDQGAQNDTVSVDTTASGYPQVTLNSCEVTTVSSWNGVRVVGTPLGRSVGYCVPVGSTIIA
jgi:hypothetical protein